MDHAKVGKTLGVLLLIALVVPFVIYAAPWVIGADASYVVLTASMTPAISPGDVVIVAEQNPETISEGDIITFNRGDENVPTTHRVIGVTETANGPEFETKGDANEDPDAGTVSPDQFVGSVILTIPLIGYVTQFASSTMGFILLVVVPFGLLLATEVWSIVRSKAEPDESSGSGSQSESVENDERPAMIEPKQSSMSDTETDASGDSLTESTTPEQIDDSEQLGVPAPQSASHQEQSEESAEELTITATDLTVSTLILAVFAGYSVYIAFNVTTAQTIGVAVGITTTFLIGLGIRLSSILYTMRLRGESDSAPATGSSNDTQPQADRTAGDRGPQTTDGGVDVTEGESLEESNDAVAVEPAESEAVESADREAVEPADDRDKGGTPK